MKALRKFLDKQATHFHKGGRLQKLFPLWEAQDTLLYSPSKVTRGASHVRDAADLKRIMTVVIVALLPCIYMAMYNTGLQAHRAIASGAAPLDNWQTGLFQALGCELDPGNWLACLLHGAIYFIPLVVFTYAVGGIVEVIFAVVRKHEINEGFFVTGMLIPLTLPPTIPYWQVALATV
ncbi:MAG: NADH:ubiquinone reductase (Na(+)-transporting) subunit B, partial [bacterium]|nr:NADH:ubiquinone reductase (Na(+)-transporting) subunit B [bacterium]